RLAHPHILPLIDSGEAHGALYYVTPHVPDGSLRQRLERERRMPLAEAIRIARDVGVALDYAHRQGFVHRDVKPENILFADLHAVLADFGIARAFSEVGVEMVTEGGLALGTPEYMSPEQASGEQDLGGRSDLYSLACVVYEMLAGAAPRRGAGLRGWGGRGGWPAPRGGGGGGGGPGARSVSPRRGGPGGVGPPGARGGGGGGGGAPGGGGGAARGSPPRARAGG